MGYNRQKIKENTFFLHFFAKIFGHIKKKQYLCTRFREGSSVLTKNAAIAQLVEHNLAKVGVASSSLVFRSKLGSCESDCLFLCHTKAVLNILRK